MSPLKLDLCLGDLYYDLNVDLVMDLLQFQIILLILDWISITHAILISFIAYTFMSIEF